MTDLDEELQQIKQRADAASGAPWEVEHGRIWTGQPPTHEVASMSGSRDWMPDAEFIASARTDVDRLLACIEAGQAHRIDGFSTVSGITYLACKCGWRVSSSFASVYDFDTHRTEQQARALAGGQ